MASNVSRHARLAALGSETLASALMRLATRDADAESLVARLLATPDDRIALFYDDLKALADYEPPSRHNRYDHNFQRLYGWLLDVTREIDDPTNGLSLLAAFYRNDEALSNQFDDEHGALFTNDAHDAFVHYAQRCQDEQWLLNLLVDLQKDDDYGLRASLYDAAPTYLSTSAMRHLTAVLSR